MKAVFIGEDGSMGFKNGKVYDVAININQYEEKVIVFSNTFPTFLCPYSNLNNFFKNWKPAVMEDVL